MPRSPRPTHLFTVRIWPEMVSENQTEWRGKVLHVPTGDALYFRNWEALVEFVKRTLGGRFGGSDDGPQRPS